MKILITSGGTSEKIDQVRSITNHSTGQLGKMIAETFLEKGDQVTLVTTPKAVKPRMQNNLSINMIENADELFKALKPLVQSHDVLIHAMAVSDYTPLYMTGFEQVAASQDLSEFLYQNNRQNKISSQDDFQVLFLKKTPKIISQVKEWNPDIHLIGFKLLVGVSKEELLKTARESLLKNQAEMIVANDLFEISDKQHRAYLVKKHSEKKANSKEEIAQLILEYVKEKL